MKELWREYTHIVSDPAHLFAELTFILATDVVIGLGLWPLVKRAVRHHDERRHNGDLKNERVLDRRDCQGEGDECYVHGEACN